jgi:hypothetical protein
VVLFLPLGRRLDGEPEPLVKHLDNHLRAATANVRHNHLWLAVGIDDAENLLSESLGV